MAVKDKAADNAAAAKPAGSKLPMMAGMAALLLLNTAVLGKVFMSGGKSASDKKQEKKTVEVGAKVSLEEFLTNLAGNDGYYLKTNMTVGVVKGFTEEKVKEEIAPIRDAVISVLRYKKLSELISEPGNEKLKVELIQKINAELGSAKVLKIYFTEFATQRL